MPTIIIEKKVHRVFCESADISHVPLQYGLLRIIMCQFKWILCCNILCTRSFISLIRTGGFKWLIIIALRDVFFRTEIVRNLWCSYLCIGVLDLAPKCYSCFLIA